jgi:hypothetical protein
MCFSIKVFIKIPNSSYMAWNRYVVPFSYGLWLAVAMSACAICVCLAITNFSHDGRSKKHSLTMSEILFYIFGCLCQQGQNSLHSEASSSFLKSYIFWVIGPCSALKINRRLRRIYESTFRV